MFVLLYCLTIECDEICQLRHFELIKDWYVECFVTYLDSFITNLILSIKRKNVIYVELAWEPVLWKTTSRLTRRSSAARNVELKSGTSRSTCWGFIHQMTRKSFVARIVARVSYRCLLLRITEWMFTSRLTLTSADMGVMWGTMMSTTETATRERNTGVCSKARNSRICKFMFVYLLGIYEINPFPFPMN